MTISVVRRCAVAILLLVFVASITVTGVVRAGDATPDAHAGHHADATPAVTAPCAAPASPTSMTGSGMTASPIAGVDMNQEFDLMFIDMMTVHHQGAIAMARVALERGEHPEIQELARAVVTTQQAEIDQMTAWRDAWYPGAPQMPMDQMNQMMAEMMSKTPAMMGTPAAGMTGMGGMMDSSTEAQALCTTAGPFDEAFLQMMIPHHQSAIAMAEVALERATRPEVKQLAKNIVDAQQREIAQMQAWLATWYGAPTGATPRSSPVAHRAVVTSS